MGPVYLVIFSCWGGPIPYLELFWVGPVKKTTLYKIYFSPDLAVFEPGARHTFDAGAGKNVANPTASLLAAAKMLEVKKYFDQTEKSSLR